MTQNQNNPSTPNCPVCQKNDRVVPIVYGLPGPGLMKKTNSGEVMLGGCMVNDKLKWYCRRDELEF